MSFPSLFWQSLLRAVLPEANITLAGTTYTIGGLRQNDTFLGFFNRSGLILQADPTAFQFASFEVSRPDAYLPWTPGTRSSPLQARWPPPGVRLQVNFVPPGSQPAAPPVIVSLIYDLYDDIPLMTQQILVALQPGANASTNIVISSATPVMLAVNTPFGPEQGAGTSVPGTESQGSPNVGVPSTWLQPQTDQAHAATCSWGSTVDSSYVPNCDCQDQGTSEPLLTCQAPEVGAYLTSGGANFSSFRALLLVHDDDGLERQSLARHRVAQLLWPWTTENPIFFHGTAVEGEQFEQAIDAMSAVGMEMYIYSFGTPFDLSNLTPAYLAQIKAQVDYVRTRSALRWADII